MGHVKEVREMLGPKFWGLIPNHKSYTQNKDFYDNESVPTKFIREEFSVTTLRLLVWLVTWSENRSRYFERDRLRAMLTAFFSSELDPSWFFSDRLVNKYNGEFDSCPLRTQQTMPCRCLRFEMRDLANSYPTWSWLTFGDFLRGVVLDTSCDAFAPVGNRLIREISYNVNA